ncbi:hypothetical protein B0H15DRAFT_337930 [Mycena belliarum]|uniref:Uncharacterized protein n=1 Tax=Mycena belliarum TaxID=1033014 RepID=A0AAD6UGG0_9AGAR|nr:hypothetical protein B0H15DRAFT_337930 [Mycena belliae]
MACTNGLRRVSRLDFLRTGAEPASAGDYPGFVLYTGSTSPNPSASTLAAPDHPPFRRALSSFLPSYASTATHLRCQGATYLPETNSAPHAHKLKFATSSNSILSIAPNCRSVFLAFRTAEAKVPHRARVLRARRARAASQRHRAPDRRENRYRAPLPADRTRTANPLNRTDVPRSVPIRPLPFVCHPASSLSRFELLLVPLFPPPSIICPPRTRSPGPRLAPRMFCSDPPRFYSNPGLALTHTCQHGARTAKPGNQSASCM